MSIRLRYECTGCESVGHQIIGDDDQDGIGAFTGMVQRGMLETRRTTILESLEHMNDITCTGCGGTNFYVSEPADA